MRSGQQDGRPSPLAQRARAIHGDRTQIRPMCAPRACGLLHASR
jgi:hypothetical protein